MPRLRIDWNSSKRGKTHAELCADVAKATLRAHGDSRPKEGRHCMIVLGIILLIIGFIAHVAILWTIGIILVLVGLALMLLGAMGRAVGGRRHYY
jgi:uncharacterized membrane protein HdeD (DUF308 family)